MIQQEGPGWRLARDPQRHPYGALIGGETWAVELTESEAGAVADGLQRAVEERRSLRPLLLQRAREYSWDACAQAVEDVWRELCP